LNQLGLKPERTDADHIKEPKKRKPLSWIAGLWLLVLSMVLISVYTLSITPPKVLVDWRFATAFIGWFAFLWLWLGNDAVPGRRKASKGSRHSWLVMGLALIIGGGLGYISGLAPVGYSVFAAFSLSSGAKIGWVYGLRGRIRYCPRCGTFTWHVPIEGSVFCNKCGHRWEKPF
jgi:hypothetical protein